MKASIICIAVLAVIAIVQAFPALDEEETNALFESHMATALDEGSSQHGLTDAMAAQSDNGSDSEDKKSKKKGKKGKGKKGKKGGPTDAPPASK